MLDLGSTFSIMNRKPYHFILDHFELKAKRLKLFLLLLVPKFNTEVVKLKEEFIFPEFSP